MHPAQACREHSDFTSETDGTEWSLLLQYQIEYITARMSEAVSSSP
jgi:hypothetical protein